MATMLLDFIKLWLSPQEATEALDGVLSWKALVDCLIAKILKSPSFSSSVPKFLAANCHNLDQQVLVARHLSQLQIITVNRIISPEAAVNGDLADGFLSELQTKTAKEIGQQAPLLATDVDSMVDWIICGQHSELLTLLMPSLLTYYQCIERSHGSLFYLPSVHVEWKEKMIHKQLASLALKRVKVLAQHITLPPLSWSMQIVTSTTIKHDRIQLFLTSNQQCIRLVGGFHAISHARNRISAHCERYSSEEWYTEAY